MSLFFFQYLFVSQNIKTRQMWKTYINISILSFYTLQYIFVLLKRMRYQEYVYIFILSHIIIYISSNACGIRSLFCLFWSIFFRGESTHNAVCVLSREWYKKGYMDFLVYLLSFSFSQIPGEGKWKRCWFITRAAKKKKLYTYIFFFICQDNIYIPLKDMYIVCMLIPQKNL